MGVAEKVGIVNDCLGGETLQRVRVLLLLCDCVHSLVPFCDDRHLQSHYGAWPEACCGCINRFLNSQPRSHMTGAAAPSRCKSTQLSSRYWQSHAEMLHFWCFQAPFWYMLILVVFGYVLFITSRREVGFLHALVRWSLSGHSCFLDVLNIIYLQCIPEIDMSPQAYNAAIRGVYLYAFGSVTVKQWICTFLLYS